MLAWRMVIIMIDTNFRAPALHEVNQNQIRKFLMEFQTCTKMDIVNRLNLSHPTASKILLEMEKKGEISYSGKEASAGGRRSEQYQLNKNFSLALSVLLEGDSISGSVINLALEVKDSCTIPVEGKTHISALTQLIADAQKKHPSLKSVTIGTPGNVNEGKIMYSAKEFYLVGTNIVELLEQKCGLPVTIHNNVNAMALGFYNKHIEVSLKSSNLAYLFWDETGPGAGFILDSKIYNGFSGFAGEVFGVWPVQKYPFSQVQSYVASIISVLNPQYLVLASDGDSCCVDQDAVCAFITENFPPHSIPRLYFSDEWHDNYIDGINALALESLIPKIR